MFHKMSSSFVFHPFSTIEREHNESKAAAFYFGLTSFIFKHKKPFLITVRIFVYYLFQIKNSNTALSAYQTI